MGKYRFGAWLLLVIYTGFLLEGALSFALLSLDRDSYTLNGRLHDEMPDKACNLVCMLISHAQKSRKSIHDHHHASPVKIPLPKTSRAVQQAMAFRFTEIHLSGGKALAAANSNDALLLPAGRTGDIPTPPPRA